MNARPANDGQLWTRAQLILAFELYCRIPFQRTKATDPRVKELAALLDRTPASIARKLGNFGAFDPQLAARNISGLTHGSKLDKEIWDEFHADWNSLTLRAYQLRRERDPQRREDSTFTAPSGPSEKIVTVKQRLHQAFFRDAVISSYNVRCCVTGLSIPECLVAGHIIPWSVDERRRADPTNGICLSATFDRLFDSGLVTINDDFTLRVSKSLLHAKRLFQNPGRQVRGQSEKLANRFNRHMPATGVAGSETVSKDRAIAEGVAAQHGQAIVQPVRFCPDLECLRWHREHRFRIS